MKAIPLGENAFVANNETFLPVDTDNEREFLQQQGGQNGEVNSPAANASSPDAVEQGVIEKISRTAGSTRDALNQHFVGFRGRLLPIVDTFNPTALIDKIQAISVRVESILNKNCEVFEAESAIREPEWRSAQEAFEKFRKDNQLIRPPDYHKIKSIAILFSVVIVAEALLNATLLWELTGFLLALGQTMLITSVNVLFGAGLAGFFFRYKNCVSRGARWLAWIVAPSSTLGVLIFNLGVGHYRDALVNAKERAEQLLTSPDWGEANAESYDLGFIDYTKQAMENIITSPFGIDSILSALLIVVGIGFFFFAAHKWYSMLDPYPGYGKSDRALKNKHKNYKELVEDTRATIDHEISDAMAHVADERAKVINMRALHDELVNRARTLREGYSMWIVVLGKAQNALLASYRDSNRLARTDPEPDHFSREEPITVELVTPPDFDPPVPGDVDSVIEAIRTEEGKIREVSVEIWRRFNHRAKMQPEPA